jgi:hypothetical protein
MTTFPPRVFSGVQPTGTLHLGNYLAAITRFTALQKTHDCVYWSSIRAPYRPALQPGTEPAAAQAGMFV